MRRSSMQKNQRQKKRRREKLILFLRFYFSLELSILRGHQLQNLFQKLVYLGANGFYQYFFLLGCHFGNIGNFGSAASGKIILRGDGRTASSRRSLSRAGNAVLRLNILDDGRTAEYFVQLLSCFRTSQSKTGGVRRSGINKAVFLLESLHRPDCRRTIETGNFSFRVYFRVFGQHFLERLYPLVLHADSELARKYLHLHFLGNIRKINRAERKILILAYRTIRLI